MRLIQKLVDKTKINRHSPIENVISFILGCLISLCLLIIYLINCINTIYNKVYIKPIIYPINYDNYVSNVSIEKIPEDIIEEPEDDIINELDNIVIEEVTVIFPDYSLTPELGKVQGPQEVETWYNKPMDLVVSYMRDMGYTEADYPYYVREDGVKMLGDFIMVAADLNKYQKGTIVKTSLGQGIVCDTYEVDEDLFDIAVNW